MNTETIEESVEEMAPPPEGEATNSAYPGPHSTRPESISEAHLKSIVESIVFVSDRPVPVKRIAKLTRAKTDDVERLLRPQSLAREIAGRVLPRDEAFHAVPRIRIGDDRPVGAAGHQCSSGKQFLIWPEARCALHAHRLFVAL